VHYAYVWLWCGFGFTCRACALFSLFISFTPGRFWVFPFTPLVFRCFAAKVEHFANAAARPLETNGRTQRDLDSRHFSCQLSPPLHRLFAHSLLSHPCQCVTCVVVVIVVVYVGPRRTLCVACMCFCVNLNLRRTHTHFPFSLHVQYLVSACLWEITKLYLRLVCDETQRFKLLFKYHLVC